MRTIGFIVVVLVIAYAVYIFNKKKEEKDTAPATGTNDSGPAENPIEELIQQPAIIIQSKLNEMINTAHEQAVILNEKVPLVSNLPNPEEIIIVPQKQVIEVTPTWQSPPAPVLTTVGLREPQNVFGKSKTSVIGRLLNREV